MGSQEKAIRALTQTHLALLAYSECICEQNTDVENETVREMCELLANQAKIVQHVLLAYDTRPRV